MKRIALLGFIVFVVPVIFTACDSCSKTAREAPQFWTYSKIENRLLKQNMLDEYHENDTIDIDTIRVSMLFEQTNFSFYEDKKSSDNYSAMACDFSPRKKNPINFFIFNIAIDGDIKNQDTTLLKSLEIDMYYSKFNWLNNREAFLHYFNVVNPSYLKANILSPHNSKYIQFVTWAIKENGDTLKAISPKVFCK